MTKTGTLSNRRDPAHDYSAPGAYQLRLDTAKDAPKLCSGDDDRRTLTESGEIFLSVVGMALHHYPCLGIEQMRICSDHVDLLLRVHSYRIPPEQIKKLSEADIETRRLMTVPMFVGFVKMHSGRQINALRGTAGKAVWTRRYQDRVLTDDSEIAAISGELQADFALLRADCVGGDATTKKAAAKMVKAKTAKAKTAGTMQEQTIHGSIAVVEIREAVFAGRSGVKESKERRRFICSPDSMSVEGDDILLFGRVLVISGKLLHVKPSPARTAKRRDTPTVPIDKDGPSVTSEAARVPLIRSLSADWKYMHIPQME